MNEERKGANAHAPGRSSDGVRLPQSVVLARLIARAAKERDIARAALLKARVALYVAEQRASSEQEVVPAGYAAEAVRSGAKRRREVLQEIDECEAASRHEEHEEADGDAAKTLCNNVLRWQKLRVEVRALLADTGEDKCCAGPGDIDDTPLHAAGGSRSKRKTEGRTGSHDRVGKKQKLQAPQVAKSSVDVANASKAVVKAEAQERKKVSEYAYLSSKRAEPAAASAAAASRNEEEEDMDNDEDSGACGKAKARDVETCPICMDERGAGSFVQLRSWSITVCGHSGCYECMTEWIARMKTCPICKQLVTTQGLYEVEDELPEACAAASSSSAAAAQAGAWGNDGMQDAIEEYGTKIAVLVKELGAVHAKGGKAVVFSAWTRLLKLAETALLANGLPTASLVGSIEAKRQALEAFSADASILLVSAHTHTHTHTHTRTYAYTCTTVYVHIPHHNDECLIHAHIDTPVRWSLGGWRWRRGRPNADASHSRLFAGARASAWD